MSLAKKVYDYSTYDITLKKNFKTKNFFRASSKTRQVFWGFEQLYHNRRATCGVEKRC